MHENLRDALDALAHAALHQFGDLVALRHGHLRIDRDVKVDRTMPPTPRARTSDQNRATVAALRELGVRKVAPSHCSGDEATAMFRAAWGDDATTSKTSTR